MSNVIKGALASATSFVPHSLESFLPFTDEAPRGRGGRVFDTLVDPREELNALGGGSSRPQNHGRESTAIPELETAREEAQRIISEAKASAGRVLDEAKAQGLRLGREEGAEAARAEALGAVREEIASVVGAFKKAAQSLDSARDKMIEDSDKELLGLVLGVARLVLGREIRMDKSLVLEQIKRAAKIVGEADKVSVKLHPLDVKIAERHVNDLVPKGKSMEFSIVPDKAVDQGGCILECNRGRIDARISTQLERISAAFDQMSEQEDNTERGAARVGERAEEESSRA